MYQLQGIGSKIEYIQINKIIGDKDKVKKEKMYIVHHTEI